MGIIILTGLNIIFVRYAGRLNDKCPKCWRHMIFAAFMLAASLIEALIIRAEIPDTEKVAVASAFSLLFVVSLLAQTTIYCIVYIVNYALTSRSEMKMHKEQANLAQYRYLKLKRQVNPHFLFNSLNILDCLVCDEKTEEASMYIHKLAGIYRYMIKSEDYELVSLREEMEFAGQYIDLLKIRFPEGFDVIIDVPQEQMARFVLPCSIQLLIENATKHNAVSTDNPLVIKIKAEADKICVSNNIVPKLTVSSSTGLGQKYIRQQYMDLSGKGIEISRTDTEYNVTLPLL
jgi:LytS/YehU family sensor histidine kinase